MTWTYSDTDLSTDLAKVRVRIGDTNTNDQMLSDEEITYFVGIAPNVILAAAECCDAIIGRLARSIDRSNLGMQATRSQMVQHYMDLSKRLRAEGAVQAGPGDLASSSAAEKDTIESNSDYPLPRFRTGQFENT